jgi:hypothetical protein
MPVVCKVREPFAGVARAFGAALWCLLAVDAQGPLTQGPRSEPTLAVGMAI